MSESLKACSSAEAFESLFEQPVDATAIADIAITNNVFFIVFFVN